MSNEVETKTTETPNGQKEAVQTPETKEKPDSGAQAVKKDVAALDAEYKAMEAEYNAMLSEKTERNAEMRRKLAALKEGPEKLIHQKVDVHQYELAQLDGYDTITIRQMVTAHLEKQWPNINHKFPRLAEKRKGEYIQEMVEYVAALRKGNNTNALGFRSHPAGRHGTQIKGLIPTLEIVPFMRIEHYR